MNIDEIRRFMRDLDTANTDSITMKVVQKVGNGIDIYTPEIIVGMRENLKNFFCESLDNKFFDLEQRVYDPSVVVEGTLQISDLATAHIIDVLADLRNSDNYVGDVKDIDIERVNYYVFEFSNNGRNLLIFRRFTKMKKIRNGLLGHFIDNTFRKIETDDFFGIDRDIDIMIFDNQALIVNRFALQTIFKLNDYFNQQAQIALKKISDVHVISNFDEFCEDCLNDKLAARRMTKILNTPGRLSGFFNHLEHLPKVIEHFDLDIIFENNQITYNLNRDSRNHILGCISDGYYQSLIQQRYGEEL
ncbi:DUF4868 domain-containing protein [Enterococcus faecium]|uniref:Kiwa anti-phage protein KwaB-like domain-containing protein n=1 Tax=Enterococcus faecium TaxID=1352 RepID=UPI0007DACE9D|nr:Kiwa anti-phage protein KwaB-like domain-containing protein [Enterococcus faecium]OAQ44885.1 hypothetical protein A5489_01430 [Enterococcus faecium]UQF16143.1 DUF4868 domain-containing protein [Enterococcus faecium]